MQSYFPYHGLDPLKVLYLLDSVQTSCCSLPRLAVGIRRSADGANQNHLEGTFVLKLLALQDFLRWWDILVFVEGTIYQIDEENEELAAEGMTERVGPTASGERSFCSHLGRGY